MAVSAKRERLIETAMRLFYTQGFHATGIDTIISEAGVARMTLYKHFKSKNDLILAVLQRRDEEFRAWFKSAVDASARRPRDKLLALFDVLEDWFTGKAFPEVGFAGCAFINACAEFAAADNPAHQMAAKHKRLLQDYVTNIARQARAPDPEGLAGDLMLLAEGAIVTMQVSRDAKAAQQAKRIAQRLLR
ncbi:MAG: TetR family transcriptional regulator, partial [Alphaproteobacteria bacterium]